MSSGMLRVVSNQELMAQERQQSESMRLQRERVESGLSALISRTWENNKAAKNKIEQDMLADLRQSNGEYSPTRLNKIRQQGGSEIFMMLTSTKCRAAAAWIRDILLPAGDKAWAAEPTPISDLPPWAEEEIMARLQATPEMGMDEERIGALRDEVVKGLREFAKTAAEKMSLKIEDQLAEGYWETAIEDFIDDFVRFPAAILKGPVPRRRRALKWGGRPGAVTPEVSDEVAFEFERVSPFDIYPSADAVEIDEGNLIERVRFTRGKLYKLIGMEGYSTENIRGVLEEYGRGGLHEWLWTDTEQANINKTDAFWRSSDSGIIDGLHFWGSAQGLTLLEWGIDPDQVPDPLAEYSIDAIKIGRYVIRAVINDDPMARRPYQKACYQNKTGSFWGKSLPSLMKDIQDVCNATARALVNNMAMASGPQMEVNYDRLAPEEDPHDQYPWKVWQTKSSANNNDPAIRFFQPDSNASELMAVYDKFEIKADDATGVPRYTYGNERVGGAGSTSSGLSMLMNAAARQIKMAIAAVDTNVIKPVIVKLHYNNMLYDPDPTIKGDVKVVARGANALLVKEQAQQRRMELLGITNNDLDMQILGIEGRADMLRDVFNSNDMPDLVPERDEFEERMLKQREEAKNNPPPNPEMEKLALMQQSEEAKAKRETDKLAAQDSRERQKIDDQDNREREKMAMEERLRQQALENELAKWREERRLQAEKEAADREAQRDIEIERIMREVGARRDLLSVEREEKEVNNAPGSQAEPMTLQVIVDNKTGVVNKKIKVNRGADGRIDTADVKETPED